MPHLLWFEELMDVYRFKTIMIIKLRTSLESFARIFAMMEVM
jgi:hypothetical protein